jgi:putative membrane protein
MGFMHLVTSAAAIWIAAYLLPGVTIAPLSIFVLAVVLGIINVFIKPIVSFLTLPLTILTLGLFSLVVNAAFVLLAAYIVPNVAIDGFVTAVLFSIIVSLVNALFAPLRWF